MSSRSASTLATNAKTRLVIADMLELPSRRPCAFWLPAVFVLIAGTILAVRNYVIHGLPDGDSSASGASSTADQSVEVESDAVVDSGIDEAGSVSEHANTRLRRLCVSMAIVTLASMVAGFSIAHLLNRAPNGFRTVGEAESRLPIPVLGAVPIQR